MNKDDRKKNAMKNLLEGLTSQETAAVQEQSSVGKTQTRATGRRGRPPRSSEEEVISMVVNKEQIAKIRVIASKHNTTIKEINSLSWENFIKKYEETYGVVRVPRSLSDDLSKVFED